MNRPLMLFCYVLEKKNKRGFFFIDSYLKIGKKYSILKIYFAQFNYVKIRTKSLTVLEKRYPMLENLKNTLKDQLKDKRQVHILMESNIDGDKSQWETTGYYEYKNKIHYIDYVDFAGNTITNNSLKIRQDMTELTRSGTSVVEMTFQAEKRHTAHYQVMTGAIEFVVFTREHMLNETDDGLDLFLDYFLENEGGAPIHNYMKIQMSLEDNQNRNENDKTKNENI